jgi:hypothetical protein
MNRSTSLYLELFRFIAALVVLLSHVSFRGLTEGQLGAFAAAGVQAVDAFFVLSGNEAMMKGEDQGPTVALGPLPAGAQFLNVIESVFSGMARAILASSNYGSIDEARAAIDRYIRERNEKFACAPKRAGGAIWGSERAPPQFSESNNCKDPLYR